LLLRFLLFKVFRSKEISKNSYFVCVTIIFVYVISYNTYDHMILTQLPLYNNFVTRVVKKLLNSQIVENTDKILSKLFLNNKKNTPLYI